MKHVLIVTGEASGDLHGANLVRAMREADPTVCFSGMGGHEMAQAGVELLFDSARVSVMGVAEVFSHIGDILHAQKVLRAFLREKRPDLLIIIDLPDFNLMLAKKAKQLSIPVFYYICPQVWAWRSGRVKTIGRRVDEVGVILPFEEQFLRERGVAATYVGHPLLDSVSCDLTPVQFSEKYQIPKDATCIGLLPGSRGREVTSLLPDFLKSARLLQQQSGRPLIFLLPLATSLKEDVLAECRFEHYGKFLDIRVIRENRYALMARCDAVVAASGTVTLELALLDVPTVVTYRLSPLSYRIGRLLIKLKHFSLVNLIAEREIIPELLQDEVTPEAIAGHLNTLTTDAEAIARMKGGLAEVRERLGASGASRKAAQLAFSILSR